MGQLFVRVVANKVLKTPYSYLRYGVTLAATFALGILALEIYHPMLDTWWASILDIVFYLIGAIVTGRICWKKAGL